MYVFIYISLCAYKYMPNFVDIHIDMRICYHFFSLVQNAFLLLYKVRCILSSCYVKLAVYILMP